MSAKIVKTRIKIRVQESAHVRAFVLGDHEKAAEHRRKIRKLKTELSRLVENDAR